MSPNSQNESGCDLTSSTDEDIRIAVQWYLDSAKILVGLNANTYATAVPIMEALMSGTPKSSFQAKLWELREFRLEEQVDAATTDNRKAAICTARWEHADNTKHWHV